MRDYLDDVLTFIGTESLTDEEFDSVTLEVTTDQVANYNALLEILQSRDAGDGTISRLQNYFLAKGIAVVSNRIPTSNIFVGSPLED